jgi:hypothetical protein
MRCHGMKAKPRGVNRARRSTIPDTEGAKSRVNRLGRANNTKSGNLDELLFEYEYYEGL